jgi:hypothetical protein
MTDRPDFSEIMAPVARALLGEPKRKLSNARELRSGSRGSLCVDLQKGVWRDHETGQGGGVLDLITREKGPNGQDRFKWLEEHGFLSPSDRDRRRDGGRFLTGALTLVLPVTPLVGQVGQMMNEWSGFQNGCPICRYVRDKHRNSILSIFQPFIPACLFPRAYRQVGRG